MKLLKETKKIHLIVLIELIILIALMLQAFYWIFIQPNIIKFDTLVFPVDKAVYEKGEHITYTFSYCKSYAGNGQVIRALIDGYRTSYQTVDSNLPLGCHTLKSNDLVIPSFLVADNDTYHIEGTATYHLNPLRDQVIQWRTEDFKIK